MSWARATMGAASPAAAAVTRKRRCIDPRVSRDVPAWPGWRAGCRALYSTAATDPITLEGTFRDGPLFAHRHLSRAVPRARRESHAGDRTRHGAGPAPGSAELSRGLDRRASFR